MAQTKAQMAEEIARLERQRAAQLTRIEELKERLEGAALERDRKADLLQRAEDWALRLEQNVKDLTQEVATRKASEAGAQRRYDQEREEHARTQRSRYEKIQRIGELEKLLVHNGKAMTRTGKAWKAVKEAAKG